MIAEAPYLPMVEYSREEALRSLRHFDPDYPESSVVPALSDDRNAHLLEYSSKTTFTHVFPGDTSGMPPEQFLHELNDGLTKAGRVHLWLEIPLCKYRCNFCQFAVLVPPKNSTSRIHDATSWVNANIAEARMWLERVPALRDTAVTELSFWGGTPTMIPSADLVRLADFYKAEFGITEATSMRLEGSPDTITEESADATRRAGFNVLTYGIQSFDQRLLDVANRRHTVEDAEAAVTIARRAGYPRVDADLVYGLPGQSVRSYRADLRHMVELGFDSIVAAKLHLRSSHEAPGAIGNITRAAWEHPQVRERLEVRGYRWPSLGEQYQMRDSMVDILGAAGYREHPTTYFVNAKFGPAVWRSHMLDQDKQYPHVGIGLGGFAWSATSEASLTADPHAYFSSVNDGVLPFETVTSVSEREQELRAVRMALSTCQPLRDDIHVERFGRMLTQGRLAARFKSLEDRGLVRVDEAAGTVTLTRAGATVVEAIMATELTRIRTRNQLDDGSRVWDVT